MLSNLANLFTVFAVPVALLAVIASVYVRRREFEDIYMERYWELQNQLPLELRFGLADHDSAGRSIRLQDESIKRVLWDYLSLCEDQIDMRQAGNVTDETWKIWGPTIHSTMKNYPFKEIFDYFEEEFDKRDIAIETRPFQQIRRLVSLDNANEFDPLKSKKVLRFFMGQRQMPF